MMTKSHEAAASWSVSPDDSPGRPWGECGRVPAGFSVVRIDESRRRSGDVGISRQKGIGCRGRRETDHRSLREAAAGECGAEFGMMRDCAAAAGESRAAGREPLPMPLLEEFARDFDRTVQARGREYFRRGAAKITGGSNHHVDAAVQGGNRYRVHVKWDEDGEPQYDC